MRVVTYIGLVARRVWARKLMLIGSFLGATLVTALLVILPLYEASVQAIDLLFTFRQAPASSVDLSAAHTQNQFRYADAEETRERLERNAAPLAEWYPEIRERIIAQEFRVIPSDFPDWFAIAEEWREAVRTDTLDEWLAGPNGQYGSPPYPVVPPEPIQTRLFTSPDLESLLEFVDGALVDDPNPASSVDPTMPVVLGETLARRAGVEVGDRIIIKGFISAPQEFEAVLVTGIARTADPSDVIWEQALLAGGAQFLSTGPDNLIFLTEGTLAAWTGVPSETGDWQGAFTAFDPETDPWGRRARGVRAAANQNFFMPLDRDSVNLENVEALTASIRTFSSNLARDEIRSLSALPGIVEEFDVRVVVFGAPIVAMLALVVAGALYFLIYMASLAVERDGNELALMRMRGASPWQTTGLHLIQSAMIAAGAMLLAPFVSRLMVSFTGLIPPMSTLTGGEALAVELSRSILPFLLVGGILTFVSMGLAVLPVARRSVLELRALATRPAHKSVWQRYHLDLFLVVLAAVLLWELRQRGIVDTGQQELGLDPFSVAAPALFLLSGALLLLRLLPWLLRGIGWVMTRIPGMTTALPGWHLGRNPIPYGRLALLVWLTTGFGAFALTYAATLEKSYDDRAAFSAGADVRLIGDGVAYLPAPEGATVSPVLRSTGAPRLAERGSELLAIDPATFPEVTAWRPDFGAATAEAAVGTSVLGPPVDWGIELPVGATRITVDGILVPESWVVRQTVGPQTPVRLMARLVDEDGQYRIHAADYSFADSHWASVTLDLSGDAAINGVFDDSASLVLQSLWVERDGGTGASLDRGSLLLDEWTVVSPAGEESLAGAITEEFEPFEQLSVSTVSGSAAATAYYSQVPPDADLPVGIVTSSLLARDGEVMRWEFPSRNRNHPVPHLRSAPEPIRVVLDRQAARAAGIGIGDETSFGFAGVQAPGTLAGYIDLVPTTGDATLLGVMVVRLDAYRFWANPNPSWALTGTLARTATPNELWVRTDDVDATVRTLLASYGDESPEVVTAAGEVASFSSRPIQVGLVAILFIGTGAGVVLALAGVTGYVLVAVRRRYREMGVLRALGFRRRGVAGTFALEQMVVLGVGALVGVGAGIGLMRLMIPFLQLGEGARAILPAATMEVAMGRLGLYLAIVAGLLVVSVLASTRSVSARRLSEVLREVER
jgi:hypothetical protein